MNKLRLHRSEAISFALLNDAHLIEPLCDTSLEASLRIIQALGHVQIDTISVVARAHHHVLWSRNRGYSEDHLDHLQRAGRQIFEYWAHAAAYLPIEAYPFYRLEMERVKAEGHDWYTKNSTIMDEVYQRIEDEGALSTSAFSHSSKRKGGWGSDKPQKHALENLFMGGVLAISHREHFKKVYDLAERVYPQGVESADEDAIAEYLIDKTARSLGIFGLQDVTYLRKNRAVNSLASSKLLSLAESGELLRVSIDDAKVEYYISAKKYAALRKKRVKPFVRILSPFDPQIINRKRLLDLFAFDYTLECYLPAKKRKFGYFALPILSHKGFIGAVDLKADRKSGSLHVRKLAFKDEISKQLKTLFIKELHDFARFNKCKLEESGALLSS